MDINKINKLLALYVKTLALLKTGEGSKHLESHPSGIAWKKLQEKYASDKRGFDWFQSANNIADVAFGINLYLGCYLVSEINSGKVRVSNLQLATKNFDGFKRVMRPEDIVFKMLDHILVPFKNNTECLPQDKDMADFNLKYWFIFCSEMLVGSLMVPHLERMGMAVDATTFAMSTEKETSTENINHMLELCSTAINIVQKFFTYGGENSPDGFSVHFEYSEWLNIFEIHEKGLTGFIDDWNEIIDLFGDDNGKIFIVN